MDLKMDEVDDGNGNTKSRLIRFCFTVNNYKISDIHELMDVFGRMDAKYVIGQEVGENGTPHLQGYCRLKNRLRFNQIKDIMPTAHIEKCRGSEQQNIVYCTKDNKFVTNIDGLEPLDDYFDINLRTDWQFEIMQLIDTKPKPRTIHWYWEPDGGRGKTTLARHLVINRKDTIVVNGSANHIKYAIVECEKKPRVIIWNVPKTDSVDFKALEEVSDGMFFSTKYESGMCVFNYVHMIVFCNYEPPSTCNGRIVIKRI